MKSGQTRGVSGTPNEMNREGMLSRIDAHAQPWDVIVIGGGATGIGVAMDAASRGLDVVLFEQADFGKSTSSRSTKLIHGGVRYLKQGNITLVRDALRERSLLRTNAPHLVHDLSFLIPCSGVWEQFYYGVGLKLYGWLAGRHDFGRSKILSRAAVHARLPQLRPEMANGGVVYHDGQFDDSRLLIAMLRTAVQQGACAVNYVSVQGLAKDASGKICGVWIRDRESDEERQVEGRCVVNASGAFCDSVRNMDDANSDPLLTVSQGIHLVLPRKFLRGSTAIMVPKTSDGRVIFLIPWHHHVIVGTTDTPIDRAELEPRPQPGEVDFLLRTSAEYLSMAPRLEDVLSIYTGIRPLVRGDKSARTASLSRDHVIKVSTSGLVTITGGKWTTVRKMAEDCVDRVCQVAGFYAKPCATRALRLHGFAPPSDNPRGHYGADLAGVLTIERFEPELSTKLSKDFELYGSDVAWAVRCEMARTIDDVLARRTRALILNARAAREAAGAVAKLMAKELRRDQYWIDSQLREFDEIATCYLPLT